VLEKTVLFTKGCARARFFTLRYYVALNQVAHAYKMHMAGNALSNKMPTRLVCQFLLYICCDIVNMCVHNHLLSMCQLTVTLLVPDVQLDQCRRCLGMLGQGFSLEAKQNSTFCTSAIKKRTKHRIPLRTGDPTVLHNHHADLQIMCLPN